MTMDEPVMAKMPKQNSTKDLENEKKRVRGN